jgi:hypothetical protein
MTSSNPYRPMFHLLPLRSNLVTLWVSVRQFVWLAGRRAKKHLIEQKIASTKARHVAHVAESYTIVGYSRLRDFDRPRVRACNITSSHMASRPLVRRLVLLDRHHSRPRSSSPPKVLCSHTKVRVGTSVLIPNCTSRSALFQECEQPNETRRLEVSQDLWMTSHDERRRFELRAA